MGANLVPIVRNFSIHTETADDHSIQDGCVTPGTHKVMRFDFLSHNIGDVDLVVGAPADRPEWFVHSAAHGHFHLKDFNEFLLLNPWSNEVTRGYKQAFCLMDIEHMSPWGLVQAKFTNCNTNQGISAGWADLYDKSLPCQFIVLDGVPDGDYILVSTTNAQRIIPEDTYADNTVRTGLRISGNSVTEIDPLLAGFRPILVNGYSLGNQDLYASIWEKREGPEWLARHRLTAEQHQQLFEQLPPQGFRPILVNGYSLGNRDLYASIWEKREGPEWLARHRLTAEQHQQLFGLS